MKFSIESRFIPRWTTVSVFVIAALGAVPGSGAGQAMSNDIIVSAEWLAERVDDDRFVVLQVGPEESFQKEHPRGATLVGTRDISEPMPTTGDHSTRLALELPSEEVLRATLGRLGIGDDSHVVVLHSDGWLSPASRLMFTLDYAGLGERSHFVDGGLEAWKEAGYPVTDEIVEPEPAAYTLAFETERVVSMDWIKSGNAEAEGFAFVDARSGAFYDGVRDDRGKVGHIPGAVSLPWTDLVAGPEEPVLLKDVRQVASLFEQAGVQEGDTVVAYCHIGQFATFVLLAARSLGHDVMLFDGSMNLWAIEDQPVVAGGDG